MPADPVVSPADTLRRDDILRHYTPVCRCEWSDDEFTRTMTSDNCVIHGKVPDPLDALLAVGERDRQRADDAEHEVAGMRQSLITQESQWLDATLAIGAERERDRRQIAQLAEALREARPIVASVVAGFDAPADSKVLEQVDAVLAGEEDARPEMTYEQASEFTFGAIEQPRAAGEGDT